jgi:YgiT-type zinc finger domain-containing protein
MSRGICPSCEQGTLINCRGDGELVFDGVTIIVPDLEFAACPICGEEVVLKDHAKRNDKKYDKARNSVVR